MRTLQDVITDPDQRVEIIAWMIQNTSNVSPVPVAVHPRNRIPMYQKLHIPNHGKWVEVVYIKNRKQIKKVFKPK